MVPTPLIMLALAVAFMPSTFGYLFAWPQRRLANWHFVQLAGCGGGMIFVLTLAVLSIRIVWLSWVLLAAAIGMIACAVWALRTGRAIQQAREADIARQRARGR